MKFRIENPVDFVRNIGATNFDPVLSSAVQDAIRPRSRQVHTERAHDLRGSDVGDMQDTLNRLLGRYGVRIMGANIPDVQLPKERDGKPIEVKAAYSKAREDVAQMLEEQETNAQRARWEIEARGRRAARRGSSTPGRRPRRQPRPSPDGEAKLPVRRDDSPFNVQRC